MSQKVLITHAVPVNNGDAALVLALYESLKAKGFDVTIATYYYRIVKQKYPNLPIIRELGDYFFLRKLPFLKPIFQRLNFWFNSRYRNNDIFIAAPGGYINSYYFLDHALNPLKLAKNDGKRTAIYAQSIGPFSQSDQEIFMKAAEYIDLLLVRDTYSSDLLERIVYQGKFLLTKDAAFLLETGSAKAKATKKAAISVREWSFDSRDMAHYLDMMVALTIEVLSDGYEVTFLSTCQGVPGYKDDSMIAGVVRDKLKEKGYDSSVDKNYYRLDQLRDKLATYDMVIGTRLHMCILSWLAGTPALNISYEVKGRECYKYLGIPEYSLDFNEDIGQSIKSFKAFSNDLDNVRSKTLDRVSLIHEEVQGDFEKAIAILAEA